MIYKHRITLFNTHWKEELLTYDSLILPDVGNIIEVSKYDLFIVKERMFPLRNNNPNFIEVTLLGVMENDEFQDKEQWNRFKEKLVRLQENDIPKTY